MENDKPEMSMLPQTLDKQSRVLKKRQESLGMCGYVCHELGKWTGPEGAENFGRDSSART